MRRLVVVLRVRSLKVAHVVRVRRGNIWMHQMEHSLGWRLHVVLVVLVMVMMMLVVLLVLAIVLMSRRGAEAHRSCCGERVEYLGHLSGVVARGGGWCIAVQRVVCVVQYDAHHAADAQDRLVGQDLEEHFAVRVLRIERKRENNKIS